MYIDVYTGSPGYAPGGSTNDTIFMDGDGTLYLGGGAGRATNALAGGVLRGDWDVTGTLTGGGLGALATEDWPASDGQEYVAKDGAWSVLGGAVSAATVTNIVNAAIVVATNAVLAEVDAKIADPWREYELLLSAPTVTVSRANARYLGLIQTNNLTLIMDAASYPLTGFATVALSISNTAAFNLTAGSGINATDWANVVNAGTNANHFLLHKPPWASEFQILQRNMP
jgi:hypothetical protein